MGLIVLPPPPDPPKLRPPGNTFQMHEPKRPFFEVFLMAYCIFLSLAILAFAIGWARDRDQAIKRGYAVKNPDFFSSDLIWVEDLEK